jgi:hypothetical protein
MHTQNLHLMLETLPALAAVLGPVCGLVGVGLLARRSADREAEAKAAAEAKTSTPTPDWMIDRLGI